MPLLRVLRHRSRQARGRFPRRDSGSRCHGVTVASLEHRHQRSSNRSGDIPKGNDAGIFSCSKGDEEESRIAPSPADELHICKTRSTRGHQDRIWDNGLPILATGHFEEIGLRACNKMTKSFCYRLVLRAKRGNPLHFVTRSYRESASTASSAGILLSLSNTENDVPYLWWRILMRAREGVSISSFLRTCWRRGSLHD